MVITAERLKKFERLSALTKLLPNVFIYLRDIEDIWLDRGYILLGMKSEYGKTAAKKPSCSMSALH